MLENFLVVHSWCCVTQEFTCGLEEKFFNKNKSRNYLTLSYSIKNETDACLEASSEKSLCH